MSDRWMWIQTESAQNKSTNIQKYKLVNLLRTNLTAMKIAASDLISASSFWQTS